MITALASAAAERWSKPPNMLVESEELRDSKCTKRNYTSVANGNDHNLYFYGPDIGKCGSAAGDNTSFGGQT
jgi:hypothetical protein